MFNGSEKVPKALVKKIDKLKYNVTFKRRIMELLNYIASSNIYNASFVDNFNLYLGDNYDSENLIFYFKIEESEVIIYDENNSGDNCKLFNEFIHQFSKLKYDIDFNGRITVPLASSKEIREVRTSLEKISNNEILISKCNAKRLITRQERINIKIEEILSRRINLIKN